MTNQHFMSMLKCTLAGLLLIVFTGCDDTKTPSGSSELKNPDKAIVVSYCSDEISGGLTTNSTTIADYGAAVDMTVDMLTLKGTHIVGVRVAIMNDATDCELFISRGLGETPMVSKSFTPIVGTWTYIALDKPLYIDGESNIYFGYKMKSIGGGMGYISGNRSSSNDHLFNNNEWSTMAENKLSGRMSIQAMVAGGDFDEKYDIALSDFNGTSYVKVGSTQNLGCLVRNIGNTAIQSYTINYSYGEETGSLTIEEKLMAGATYLFNMPTFTAPNTPQEVAISISVTANNVTEDVTNNNSITESQLVYDQYYPRTMMLEQFTGQNCGNCPAGTNYIKTNLKDYLDNIVWAAHHVGYGNDDFTISKSSPLTAFYNANGTYAPAMMLDRTYIPALGEPGPVAHPTYFTDAIGKELSEVPSFVQLNIDRTFNAENTTLNITVSGDFILPLSNPRMNIFIIQDSIVAFQAPRDSNYVHNRAVREILTPTWGDEMTVANDGTFSMTYTYQVPDTIGKFATVLKNMEVQAFVTNFSSSVNKREVQNATKIALLPEETILPNE